MLIDKTVKFIYNKIRILCTLPSVNKKALISAALSLLIFIRILSFSSYADKADRTSEVEQLSLTLSHRVDGSFVIIDLFCYGQPFCALFMTLSYDSNVFLFDDAQIKINEYDFNLTYLDKDGKISFLIDGTDNYIPDADPIVSFVFSFDQNVSGEFDFLLLPTEKLSACRISDGEIKHMTAIGESLIVNIASNVRSCSFKAISAEVCDQGLVLSGRICGDVGFSVGFEVSFSYFEGKSAEVFITSRAISPSDAFLAKSGELEFVLTIPISVKDIYCINVTPFSCFRDGNIFGENNEYCFQK